MNVIEIENLDFGYNKKQLILNDLSLRVPQNSIFAFLGANGAGKSTTIRSILDLETPNKGSIKLFNQSIKKHRKVILSKVGALIESPALYNHLTGYENLKIYCKYLNIPSERIDIILEKIGMTQQAHKKCKAYSTGMRQRLGLGLALLKDPALLILDEPTNGLDPQGIIAFRDLLLSLKAAGKTIFISSHLLAEVEKIATHIGILKDGKIVFQGTMNALQNLKDTNIEVVLKVSNIKQARSILSSKYKVETRGRDTLFLNVENKVELGNIADMLVENEIKIYELTPQKKNLEMMFLGI